MIFLKLIIFSIQKILNKCILMRLKNQGMAHSEWAKNQFKCWNSNASGGADVGGQQCPCPVRVSFLSGFAGKSCPMSVRCLDSVRILSVSILCAVRIFKKQTVRCLSVRVLSVSILSAVRILSGFLEKCCPVSVCPDFQWSDRQWSPMILRSLASKDETFLIKFLVLTVHQRHLFLQEMNLFMVFFHNFLNLMSRKSMFYWFNFFFQLRRLALSLFYQSLPDESVLNYRR